MLNLADARRKQKEDELLALALGSSRVMAQPTFPGQRPLYTSTTIVSFFLTFLSFLATGYQIRKYPNIQTEYSYRA